jgi:hypothetical protein
MLEKLVIHCLELFLLSQFEVSSSLNRFGDKVIISLRFISIYPGKTVLLVEKALVRLFGRGVEVNYKTEQNLCCLAVVVHDATRQCTHTSDYIREIVSAEIQNAEFYGNVL